MPVKESLLRKTDLYRSVSLSCLKFYLRQRLALLRPRSLTQSDQASGSLRSSPSVAAHCGGDVSLIARRVGQRPP